MLERSGWYEVLSRPHRSTTRQVAGLFHATTAAPTPHEGIVIGKEMHSGWPFIHDVFAAYNKTVKSPNVIVLGDVGFGKSSFIKTWGVLRQLMLGRRVVVIDKKKQRKPGAREGEYADLARELGVEPIRFVLGAGSNGSRINILDPLIAGSTTDGDDGGASQMELLRAVLREALGRKIQPMEGKALAVARKVAVARARAAGQEATIRDVVSALEDPPAEAMEYVSHRVTQDKLAKWGQEAAAELERMVTEDLAGLFDGPTSDNISLTSGLTVFDISALPESGPAVPIVMAVVNAWMRAALDRQTNPVRTVMVIEEGWHVMDGTFAKVTRSNQKISRGDALMNITAMHHVSDVPKKSPAIAIIKEADTIVLYRQSTLDDARRAVKLFNLPSYAVGTLMELPEGAALIKIGSQKPVIVKHVRSEFEKRLTDTDSAMQSEETLDLHDRARGPVDDLVDDEMVGAA
ncbi:ATP/GTP-binding protein [Isoptericola rhizosphaerae]|uniref:ATP/GTP-binding protein n=1 Tax=Isoptericola rhizosphaerae TaxID=3377837 RepID=UPI00383BBC71